MTDKPLTPADMARRGHKTTQERYGREHYVRMNQKSQEAKRLKKEVLTK